METSRRRPGFSIVAFWGVTGFVMILVQAIWRLSVLAIEPISDGQVTEWWQWGMYVASIVVSGYSEGYRGFHLKAAPRIVVRALHLGKHPRPIYALLAPLYCTALFHTTSRRLVATWSLYGSLVLVIIAVRQVPQPWRGVIDAGVVVGLGLGAISILVYYGRALAGRPPQVSAELPGHDAAG